MTDSLQCSASPMPASVLARLIDSRLSRFLRRRAASGLLPFHHASAGEGGRGFLLGGQYGAASAVWSRRGHEVPVCSRPDASMFRALFSAIRSHPVSGAACSIEVFSRSNRSPFPDLAWLTLATSLGVRGMIAPSVKVGVE